MIDKMNEHYSMTNPASIYDEEALTALELAGRTAAKMNETIGAFNALEEETQNHLHEQDKTIDERMDAQDKAIPEEVSNEMDKQINAGVFDTKISDYAGNLSQRVDNLLSSTPEGGTTSDAELIDIRTGEGIVFDNAGNAVRKQISSIKDVMNFGRNFDSHEILNVGFSAGYITSSYTIHAQTEALEVTTTLIPVEKGDQIRIICLHPDELEPWAGVVTYDENENPIWRAAHAYNHITHICLENEKYLRFSIRTYGYSNVIVMKFNYKSVDSSIPTYDHKPEYQYIPLNCAGGYIGSSGELRKDTYPMCGEVTSDFIPVSSGEVYRIISNVWTPKNMNLLYDRHYHWVCVAFYDAQQNFISRPSFSIPNTEEHEDGHYCINEEFTISGNVSYIKISSRTFWNGKVNLVKVKNNVNDSVVINTTDTIIKGVGHRGVCGLAPENTLPSYIEAKKQGFTYVECDLYPTSENIPVLIHDSTIDRTSNGTGNVSDMTLEQLRTYDFGGWFSEKYSGTKIPTFEEFIVLCKKLSLKPYVELKAGDQTFCQTVHEIVKKYGMTKEVTFLGQSSRLEFMKNFDSSYRLGYVVRNVTEETITATLALKNDENEVFVDSSTYTEEEINLCYNANLPLEVWTYNDKSDMCAMPAYVSGITSDYYNAGVVILEKALEG